MKINPCKYCGFHAEIDEGLSPDEWRVECSNVNGCKAWIRIYSRFKKYAIEAWNEVNPKI